MGDFNNDNNENKKSLNNEKLKSKWIEIRRRLFNKDGFYLGLFICVCIVAITAVWVSKRNIEKYEMLTKENEINELEKDIEDIFNKDNIITIVEDSLNDLEGNLEKTDDEEVVGEALQEQVVAESEKSEDLDEEESVETLVRSTKAELLQELVLPARGTVSMKFSMENLIYSETLDQWTTHNGLDIRSVAGSEVVAILDGIITDITESDDLGIVVTIDHGAGIVSKYGFLSTDKMIEIGQRVSKKEVISGIGKAVGFELSQGPHLHFELIVDGEHVDPSAYLPKIK